MKKRKPLISPRTLSRMLQSAAECWQLRQFEKYYDIMESASRLDPSNHRVLLELGLAYGIRYDFSAAANCFERAITVAPEKSEVLVMVGTHCRNISRYDLARHYFERAVERPDA